eukprot:4083756-Pleurochrysis_carterae.AAC.1
MDLYRSVTSSADAGPWSNTSIQPARMGLPPGGVSPTSSAAERDAIGPVGAFSANCFAASDFFIGAERVRESPPTVSLSPGASADEESAASAAAAACLLWFRGSSLSQYCRSI